MTEKLYIGADGRPCADNNPVGYIEYLLVPPEAEIYMIEVAPEFRRRGYGRKILAAFLTIARGAGVNTVFLEVSKLNTAALNLYLSAGFAAQYERKAYYPDGGDAVIMKLKL